MHNEKKYIGKYPPSIHKSRENDCSAIDTVIDHSKSTEDF